jgi:predicted phage terminase large subunit-like protein
MTNELTTLLRTELLAFAMKAYAGLNQGKTMEDEPFLWLVAHALEGVSVGDTRRLVLNLPPRHYKTFLGSICLPAWVLAHDPAAKILLLSYGQELADKTAYSIRAILKMDWFKKSFLGTRLAKDRGRVSDFLTTKGGGVRSISVEGGVTGQGADFIIIDDPSEIKDHAHELKLERIAELFDSEIRTRLNNPKVGRIVLSMHRLNENDLAGHVLQEKGWKKLALPFIAMRARDYDLGTRVWHRRKGDLLRPSAFRLADIAKLRSAKGPGFETLYQQTPGRRERLRFKAEHFPGFEAAPNGAVVLSIDPGQKGGPRNACHVVQAWAVDAGDYYLIDQFRDHCAYSEFRAGTVRFIKRYRPSVILIEATGLGPALLSDLRPQTGMDVIAITPTVDKVARLKPHRQLIRKGRVRLPKNALWVEDFLSEVTAFPYAEFDDQVDATSQFLEWITRNPSPPKRPPLAIGQGANRFGSFSANSSSAAVIRTNHAAIGFNSRVFNPFRR